MKAWLALLVLSLAPLVACGARTALGLLASADAGSPGDAAADVPTTPSPCGAAPTVIASGQPDPVAVAVAGTSVFWTTQPIGVPTSGGVYEATAAPNAFVEALAPQQGFPLSIAVAGAMVYWTSQWFGFIAETSAGGGGAVKQVVTGLGQNDPGYLAVDAASLYWSNFGNDQAATGSIEVMPLSGGTPRLLAMDQAQPWQIAVDADAVYWIDIDEPDDSGGSVMKVPLGGGPATTLAPGQHLPLAIALDADTVYFTNGGTRAANFKDGAVLSVPKAGGAVTTLATGQQAAGGVATDGTGVYWVTAASRSGDGTVMKVPKAGGNPVTLASGQASPTALAVDAHCVYWLNAGTGGNDEQDGMVQMTAK